jgi:hypothetical protein
MGGCDAGAWGAMPWGRDELSAILFSLLFHSLVSFASTLFPLFLPSPSRSGCGHTGTVAGERYFLRFFLFVA